jgi:signal transduction histidine kinase
MSNPVNTIEANLVSHGEPHQIMGRLVRFAAENADVDRCTLTSLDQRVMRVEASYEHGGPPDFVGREYPLDWLQQQPLLNEAVTTGTIRIGGGFFGEHGRSDPALSPALLDVRHTAIVPLPVGDTVGALLILSRKSDRPFVPQELAGLQQVGMLAVLALRNARLVEEVQSAQRRGLDSLTQMSRHIAASMDPATFFEKMGEAVAGLVHAERAAFWQLSGDGLIAMHGSRDAGSESFGGSSAQTLDPGTDPGLARLIHAGEALRVARDGENDADPGSVLARMDARDVLAVPWRTAAVPLGILSACNAESGFTDQDEWIMRLAARSSALVWQGYEAEHRAEELQAAELDRLAAHAGRMAELEQQKSEFLQLASHELRSPITLVSGYLSMLEEGALGELPEAAARVVPLMGTRMRDMRRLVDRMLTTSRMEMRARDQNAQAVSVDELARAVVASISPAGGETAREVTVESSGNTVVRGDAEQIETILTNLVSNALKYSPDGGEVRVNVREESGWVVADVTDSGFGIADEDIPNLFQPFGRLQSAVAAGIEGTGLGLHVSRTLALAQGGDILVSSRPGEGSTFTLRLPSGRGMA